MVFVYDRQGYFEEYSVALLAGWIPNVAKKGIGISYLIRKQNKERAAPGHQRRKN